MKIIEIFVAAFPHQLLPPTAKTQVKTGVANLAHSFSLISLLLPLHHHHRPRRYALFRVVCVVEKVFPSPSTPSSPAAAAASELV